MLRMVLVSLSLSFSLLLYGCPPAPDIPPPVNHNGSVPQPTKVDVGPIMTSSNGITRVIHPLNGRPFYSRDPDNNSHWYSEKGQLIPNEPDGHRLSDLWRREYQKLPTDEGQKVVAEFNRILPEAE